MENIPQSRRIFVTKRSTKSAKKITSSTNSKCESSNYLLSLPSLLGLIDWFDCFHSIPFLHFILVQWVAALTTRSYKQSVLHSFTKCQTTNWPKSYSKTKPTDIVLTATNSYSKSTKYMPASSPSLSTSTNDGRLAKIGFRLNTAKTLLNCMNTLHPMVLSLPRHVRRRHERLYLNSLIVVGMRGYLSSLSRMVFLFVRFVRRCMVI